MILLKENWLVDDILNSVGNYPVNLNSIASVSIENNESINEYVFIFKLNCNQDIRWTFKYKNTLNRTYNSFLSIIGDSYSKKLPVYPICYKCEYDLSKSYLDYPSEIKITHRENWVCPKCKNKINGSL